jgi:ornithine cyclodeaminase/alanine dehydrogenase-like protein (mu-crystallin family)
VKPPTTRILTRDDIAQALSLVDCITAVEQVFALAAEDGMLVPQVVHLPVPEGAFHVKSAAYRLAPHYVAVKVNGNFPGNPKVRGLPTIQGAILLSDARDGRLLAIMDSIEVTALRTGAATAVAARHLAPRPVRNACVIGCGFQGQVQLRSLLEVFTLERVFAADADPGRAREYAEQMQRETGCEVVAVDDFARAARQSEIVVTCTPSRQAFLRPEHVAPGTLIAAIGADDSSKQEIAPELMARAKVVVDNLDQCVEMGDLHHAIAAGAMSREDVLAELGEVVAGRVNANITADDVVVFDSTGIATQDVAAAGMIYERANAAGIGTTVVFNR